MLGRLLSDGSVGEQQTNNIYHYTIVYISQDSKTPQKRGAAGGATPGRVKRAKKDSGKGRDSTGSKELDQDITDAVLDLVHGRPSPASTPGSDAGKTSQMLY